MEGGKSEEAVSPQLKRHAAKVLRRLKKAYPEARCALVHRNPYELLVATVLSAQCTDKRVNMVTPELFRRCPTPDKLAAMPSRTLERLIQSTGFFRTKARNLKECCRRLVEEFGGEVPRELEVLVALPGVGRKTANVVLGTAYGIPSGVVVDTHVARISRRLGLTRHRDPGRIERDLMALLPRREWIDFSHRVIHLGREYCLARRPRCHVCPLADVCPRIGVPSGTGTAQGTSARPAGTGEQS